jgi:uncharacterized protein
VRSRRGAGLGSGPASTAGEFDIFQNGEPLNYAVDVDPLELEWFDTWLKHREDGDGSDTDTPSLLRPRERQVRRNVDVSLHLGYAHSSVPRRGREAHANAPSSAGAPVTVTVPSSPDAGALSPPKGSVPAVGTSDTIMWTPAGAPCGRPIDQWSMGGISVPAGSAGLLAPCASNDQLAETGRWAITYTSSPFARPETIAGPITATAYASSTTSETELVAELEDVTPNGTPYAVTEGGLLGSLRAVDRRRSRTSTA